MAFHVQAVEHITLMKRLMIVLSLLGLATGLACAFGLIGKELWADPSPRPLPEDCALALQALGPDTNEFYCVSARRSHEWCHSGEWVFTFDRNYIEHKLVFVAMRAPESYHQDIHLKPWPLTEVRETNYNSFLDRYR